MKKPISYGIYRYFIPPPRWWVEEEFMTFTGIRHSLSEDWKGAEFIKIVAEYIIATHEYEKFQ